LPAQFFSLLSDAEASRGAMKGLAIIAAKRLMKALLFMAIAQADRHWSAKFPLLQLRKRGQLYTLSYRVFG
jgi:hypothetical protein